MVCTAAESYVVTSLSDTCVACEKEEEVRRELAAVLIFAPSLLKGI